MSRPTGGFILWVSLPGRVNTQELHVRALQQGISIAPGLIFSNTEQFNHCIRLNCGTPWNREAERALMTLGLLATNCAKRQPAGSYRNQWLGLMCLSAPHNRASMETLPRMSLCL